MNNGSATPLPSYKNPPVNEVVCGITFESIDALLSPHLGLLWERFKPDYNICQDHAPLAPVIERFDSPGEPAQATFAMMGVPPLPRVWFVQEKGNGIVQVQRDRFLHNWRKLRPEDQYPRYHPVIEMFRDRFSKFEAFLAESHVGTVKPIQYEMTYVNLIPEGDGWTTLADVGKILLDSGWKQEKDRFLPPPERISWKGAFVLPDKLSRLHVVVQSAVRRSDTQPVIQMELTVRGSAVDESPDSMWHWFDVAREWIVRGFTDLTTNEVQTEIWRRES